MQHKSDRSLTPEASGLKVLLQKIMSNNVFHKLKIVSDCLRYFLQKKKKKERFVEWHGSLKKAAYTYILKEKRREEKKVGKKKKEEKKKERQAHTTLQ